MQSGGPTHSNWYLYFRATLKLWIIWIQIWKFKFHLILNLASILQQIKSLWHILFFSFEVVLRNNLLAWLTLRGSYCQFFGDFSRSDWKHEFMGCFSDTPVFASSTKAYWTDLNSYSWTFSLSNFPELLFLKEILKTWQDLQEDPGIPQTSKMESFCWPLKAFNYCHKKFDLRHLRES